MSNKKATVVLEALRSEASSTPTRKACRLSLRRETIRVQSRVRAGGGGSADVCGTCKADSTNLQ